MASTKFLSLYNKATLAIGDSEEAGIQLVKHIKEWNVTVFPSMPHLTQGFLKLMSRYKDDLKVRIITNTGERLPSKYVHKIKEFLPGCNIF